jgi:hypothetical protein
MTVPATGAMNIVRGPLIYHGHPVGRCLSKRKSGPAAKKLRSPMSFRDGHE